MKINNTDRMDMGDLIANAMEGLDRDIKEGIPLDGIDLGFQIYNFEVVINIKKLDD